MEDLHGVADDSLLVLQSGIHYHTGIGKHDKLVIIGYVLEIKMCNQCTGSEVVFLFHNRAQEGLGFHKTLHKDIGLAFVYNFNSLLAFGPLFTIYDFIV